MGWMFGDLIPVRCWEFFSLHRRVQLPIQLVPGALSMGVKLQGLEADHSPPSSAEVKECVELYLHSPDTPSWRGAQLKHRNNFNFASITAVHR